MIKSEVTNNIAKALCEVQKTALFALTDKENPFFQSKYADLSSVWEVARKPLTDNGLSVVQTMDISDGGVIVETTLLHISGEYITGRLFIKPEKNTPQGIGSAITYARRYSFSAMIGISTEDDDGERAMGREKNKNKGIADYLIAELEKTTTLSDKDDWKKKHTDEINDLDEKNRARVIAAGVAHTKKLTAESKAKNDSESEDLKELAKDIFTGHIND